MPSGVYQHKKGEESNKWKGGLPYCFCGKQLSRKKYSVCRKHSSLKGEKNPCWKGGLPYCEICNKKLSQYGLSRCKNHRILSVTARINLSKAQSEEKNSCWKGDKVGYVGLHRWVRRHLGTPKKCENCGKDDFTSNRQIHWANKSRKYFRKLDDWIRLCVFCHKAYDSKQSINIRIPAN